MCRRAWLAVSMAFLMPLAAHGGRNAGGALIVHTDNDYDYTSAADPCRDGPQTPSVCGAAVTQSSRTPGDQIAVIWFLAAVHPEVIPGLTAVQFGVEHNLSSPASIAGFGHCGPPQSTLELREEGWPFGQGGGSGTVVAFGEAIRLTVVPVYWFAVVADDSASYFGSAPHVPGGAAIFVDDRDPPGEDRIDRFGTIRWNREGGNDCPVQPAVGGCCTPWASCVIRTEFDCERGDGEFGPSGGVYIGDETACEPEPVCGACCFWNTEWRECRPTTRDLCEALPGGEFSSAGLRCFEPGEPWESLAVAWYCSEVPAKGVSWGRLRALFR